MTQAVERIGDVRRIAGLLDLPDSVSDRLGLARCVSGGLPVQSALHLREVLRPATFHRIIPEPTFRRVKGQGRPLTRETSEKLYEFSQLYARLQEIYHGDEALVTRFLETPNGLLGGQSPLELATSSSAGADAVQGLLDAADAGFAV